MEVFPSRSTLYRTAWRFVIWASLTLLLTPLLPGQASRTAKRYKGPRALGLIELAPNGKAHLIPITILYDGEFYDASAYKASPVPMALWAETVYEGFRTGVSQGLFTVSTALENQQTHEWLAEGKWLPAGSIPAKLAKKESSVPRGMNEDEGPPVLRHSGSAKPKAPEPPAQQTPPATPPAPSTTPSPTATPPSPTASNAPSTTPQTAPQASTSDQSSEPEDKDRPQLKRGKPTQKPEEAPAPTPAAASKTTAHAAAPAPAVSSPKPQVQPIPAISDADGPDPQPYTYDLKPDEEHQLRDKMLALAADQVRGRAKQLASEAVESSPPARTSRKSTPQLPVQPSFEDVQFRAFDLSNSNEPVLVLTAKARLPKTSSEQPSAELQYMVTLVARQDINGDLNKALSNVTDNQHLDVIPDMQLIDAVDADGDGRGELLFRQVSDAGTAYVVYRVIGDQLYALFQGSPQ